MFSLSKPFLAGTIAVVAAATAWTTTDTLANDTAPNCQIEETSRGSALSLKGAISSVPGTTGTYSFSVEGTGTNIRQRGRFTTDDHGKASLGSVLLGNSGAVYDARLIVNIRGKAFECADRFGDLI